MNAPLKRKTRTARCGINSKDSDDQAPIEIDHNPVEFQALVFAMLSVMNAARVITNKLAIITTTPPFVIVEAANLLENACELVANYLVTGGQS